MNSEEAQVAGWSMKGFQLSGAALLELNLNLNLELNWRLALSLIWR